jgi:hypothetical protein
MDVGSEWGDDNHTSALSTPFALLVRVLIDNTQSVLVLVRDRDRRR